MKPSTIRYMHFKNIGFPQESDTIDGDMRTCLAAIMNYWVNQTMGSRMEIRLFRTETDRDEYMNNGVSGDSKEAATTLDALFNELDYSKMVD